MLRPFTCECTTCSQATDGSASLKWGSTNVYTEDASGHPIYSWEILDHIFDTFHSSGLAVLALPYMDTNFKQQVEAAVRTYVVELDKELSATPFAVPPSLGGWGGSMEVVDLGVRMYFLHKAFPELVDPEYTLRAANYILGTHPVSSTSYVSSVGTVSKLKAYGNNRADNTFIPGGVIPGYIIIKPDSPECIDDFGFLWFEDEYVIDVASRWVLAANAADALVNQAQSKQP